MEIGLLPAKGFDKVLAVIDRVPHTPMSSVPPRASAFIIDI